MPSEIGQLKDGDHLFCLYGSEEERDAILLPLLQHGIDQGDKILVFCRDGEAACLRRLSAPEGRLAIRKAEDAFFSNGTFDPSDLMGRLEHWIDEARNQGHGRLRVICDVPSLQPRDAARLVEHESALNRFLAGRAGMVAGLYDRRCFDPELLFRILCSCPLVALDGEIHENSYFVPPDGLTAPERFQHLIDLCTQNLKKTQKIKEMEKEHHKTEQRYQDLVDMVPISVIEIDRTGLITYINRRGINVSGYTNENFAKGVNIQQLVSSLDLSKLNSRINRILQGEKLSPTEYKGRRSDGSLINIIAYSCPIFEDGGTVGLRIAILDITEQKKMEEEVQRAQKLESLGIIAGGIAHDFNNLLTGIIGNISLAKMHFAMGRKPNQALEEAEKAGVRAKALTQQLLTFSKGEAPIRKTASIAHLLRDTARFVLSGSRITCEFGFEEGLWAVEIDKEQISRVFENLILNADQAMPDGGILRIHAENEVVELTDRSDQSSVEPGRFVKIRFVDQGVGIPAENLSRVFDPYFTTKQGGTGLGLATSHSVIRKHNGLITVESVPGKGTVFTILLPASEKSLSAQAEKEKEAEEALLRGSGRILIMDDDPGIRILISRTLETLGYDTDSAVDGSEAIDKYRAAMEGGKPFDAVIMDLTVPGGMGGREAMERLLLLDPNAVGIVSSGYSDDPVVSDFRRYGFSGVAKKPYNVTGLAAALRETTRTK